MSKTKAKAKAMKKRSASQDLATFPSPPGAPQHRAGHKGSASERVPAIGAGRHVTTFSAGAAAPPAAAFSSGRAALPSKWEDAERWICSPLNGGGGRSGGLPAHKRPKSKSGPIMQTAAVNYAATAAAFSTGVLAAESVLFGVNGCNEMKEIHYYCPSPKISLSSESKEGTPTAAEKSSEGADFQAVSQRDMATQMSPRECRCSHSSPAGRPSFASSPAALLSETEQQSEQFNKLEVRDVEVDKRATVIKWSKKGGFKIGRKSQPYVDDFGGNSYDISEAAMDNSKWEREEAKITAWENLQKAKAEAAIRKLEMKLEKKRSETMDKILDKHRASELRAHKMRSQLLDDHDDDCDQHQAPRSPRKLFSFRKHIRVGSLSRLFACRSFFPESVH